VILIDFDARSNVIKFGVAVLLLLIYYFRSSMHVRLLELSRKMLMVAPAILFFLAVTGVFNIFNMNQYLKGDYIQVKKNSQGQIENVDLKSDTRTFLYYEVIQSSLEHNYWLLGRSPARGNDTKTFEDSFFTTGRYERTANEVGILNVFTWTGIIGVILYFFVFYRASYLAINQSNNIFSKMLGTFVAFHWLYAWVEDINEFSIVYVTLWFMIALCFSQSFRIMSNNEVKRWARGIFDKRYRRNETLLPVRWNFK
jgi:O-antigen ligase